MTYAVAWHDGIALYFLADTAYTRPGEPREQLSTFGEAPHTKDGHTTEEARLKVVRLGSQCLASYCGHVGRATAFLASLQQEVEMPNLPDRIGQVEKRLGPFASDVNERFEILVGRLTAAKESELFHYSSATPGTVRMVRAGEGKDIGSLPHQHRPDVHTLCTVALQERRDPNHPLVVAAGFLQRLAATEYLLAHHVGGAFVGAYVDANGVHWQPDTRYILYDPTLLEEQAVVSDEPPDEPPTIDAMHFVRCVALGDGAALESSFWPGRVRVLTSHFSGPWERWVHEWRHEVERRLDHEEARFWVYISTSLRRIVILDRNVGDNRQKAMKLDNGGGYATREDLLKLLVERDDTVEATITVLG